MWSGGGGSYDGGSDDTFDDDTFDDDIASTYYWEKDAALDDGCTEEEWEINEAFRTQILRPLLLEARPGREGILQCWRHGARW
jgi:hypothetical protein